MEESVIKYMESPRRKALEEQYRESIQRPIKLDLKEVVENQQAILRRLSSLEHYVTSIFNLIHHREE